VATVYLSSGLAQFTGGVETLTIDAPRVCDLMDTLAERFPSLREPLALMSVAVDGEIRQHADYVKLSARSEVHLIPRISGG